MVIRFYLKAEKVNESDRGPATHTCHPSSQRVERHEVDDSLRWNLCPQRRGEAELDEFELPRMMSVSA